MGRRTRAPRRPRLTALAREDLPHALQLWRRLEFSTKPLKLSGGDRTFLADLLLRAINDGLGRKAARNFQRDIYIAADFHSRQGRNRAKEVAKAWAAFNVKPRHVASIASRYRELYPHMLELDGDGGSVERLRETVELKREELLQNLRRI